MVPSAFVLLPELPLTPNGKVERRALFAGTAVRPPVTVETIPPPSENDLHRLLVEWNDTGVVHADARCLHQLVEAQVDRTPDAIAVVSGGEAITYEALNARANQLARLLRRRGAGPDVLVGLCLERPSRWWSAPRRSQAGGAYVPLEIRFLPQDRVSSCSRRARACAGPEGLAGGCDASRLVA